MYLVLVSVVGIMVVTTNALQPSFLLTEQVTKRYVVNQEDIRRDIPIAFMDIKIVVVIIQLKGIMYTIIT